MLPTDFSEPKIIDFPSVGTPNSGFITIAEFQKTIPFEIKRVYWTYYTPHHIERGGHAHHELYQVLVAACGIVDISCEDRAGNINNFILNSPDKGLILPPPFWHTMRFSHNSVLLCLASELFYESDYIRDYSIFKGH